MPQQVFRGVMVGAGFFAGYQAEAWRRIQQVQLIAVADLVRGRSDAFARLWDIPRAYTSVDEMLELEQADFVDIVTRPESHLELTQSAAERGIHVICQKPMAPSWEECLAMVEVCEKAQVRLLIHENWRWQPWYRELKRILSGGQLGDPFYLNFQLRGGDGCGTEPYPLQTYFREMPRLLVYETLVHLLDAFRFLLGEIESLYCQMSRVNPAIRGEDHAIIQVRFASGVHGIIDANRINGPNPPEPAMGSMRLECTNGFAQVAPDGCLRIAPHREEKEEYSFPSTKGYRGDSVYHTQLHLADSLLLGKPAETEGREYLKTVAAAIACYESSKNDKVVWLSN